MTTMDPKGMMCISAFSSEEAVQESKRKGRDRAPKQVSVKALPFCSSINTAMQGSTVYSS